MRRWWNWQTRQFEGLLGQPMGVQIPLSAPFIMCCVSRPKANSDFFKTWSGDMAYVLGFIVTDGCLVEHKNGYNALNITNKDKGILKKILLVMDSDHKISVKSRGSAPEYRYFQIQIRNKNIYDDLLKLGLTPRKSKTIRMPIVPSEFFGDFVRGCFDGDGAVSVWQDPRWKHAWQIRSVFCSGSLAFLQVMQKRLCEKADLSKGSIQRLAREYLLCYSIADSIKLHDAIYKKINYRSLFFKRKKDKFEFFRKVRPEKFTNVAPSSSLAQDVRFSA